MSQTSPQRHFYGSDPPMLEVPGDHFSITDPAAPAWPVVTGALEELMSQGS